MPGARASCLFIALLCLTAAPVCAQTPVVTVDDFQTITELTAGVSTQLPADVNQRPVCQELGLPCSSPRTFPDFGVAVALAVYPIDAVGIVGEGSVYANGWLAYGRCPFITPNPQPCANTQVNQVWSALAGVRVRTPIIRNGGSHWRLFGQALAGPQWSDVGPQRRVFQPGIGGDNDLQNGIAVHLEYDYRFAPDDRRDLSTGRFVVGISIPLGRR
jgi:hypothetical protein